MIRYRKIIKKFKERGVNSNTAKKNHIVGQETYRKIMNGGNIDMRTIDNLCKYFDCQPGDILEYVRDRDRRKNDEDA